MNQPTDLITPPDRRLHELVREFTEIIPLAEAYAVTARLVRASLGQALSQHRDLLGYRQLHPSHQSAWRNFERQVSPPEVAEALVTLAARGIQLPQLFNTLPHGPVSGDDLGRAVARLRLVELKTIR
jgi:hypothetical protein